jgi:lipopolysaccharide transport system ATP-binding protein
MSDLAIDVKGLSKRYRIGLKEKETQTFAGQLVNIMKAPVNNFRQLTRMTKFGEEDESVFWALKDINFTVKQGEVLGIIGRNGAGKSTLLKILSRITEPTSGEVLIKGRVASLLEVGTGFHPELTGRENIYMNGTILGMTKREIDRKLDEIIDFSGVEKFVDTPVKFYSSGMKVRLGFSVAAHLEPEILIIDEVLAVGDFEFQKKCLGKMEDVADSGRTVLFVSHNMSAVQNLCTRIVLLRDGSVGTIGEVSECINQYVRSESSNDRVIKFDEASTGSKDIIVTNVKFYLTGNPDELDVIISGADITVVLDYKCKNPEKIKELRVAFAISTIHGTESFACDNFYLGKQLPVYKKEGKLELRIRKWPLNKGVYKYRIHIENRGELSFRLADAGEIIVLYGDFFKSGFVVPEHLNGALIEHDWNIN